MIKNTLIFHDGALGDVLLSLPCIKKIREESVFVHGVGRFDVYSFLKEMKYVDRVSSSDSVMFTSLYNDNIDEKTGRFLSEFDQSFVFTVKDISRITENIGKIILSTNKIITVPPDGVRMHVSEFRFKQISGKEKIKDHLPMLKVPYMYKKKAKELLDSSGYPHGRRLLFALHPGSGSIKKNWPLEKYFDLVKKIKDKYNPFFIFFSGPAEDNQIKDTINSFLLGKDGMIHISDHELTLVSALLQICDVYIGNDSGITHLASSLGCNTIAIFRVTDPFLWGPVNNKVKVISASSRQEHDPSALSIEVNKVFNLCETIIAGTRPFN
jgi:heptosyltransferase-3